MRECAPDDRLRDVSNHDPLSVMAGLRPGHPGLSCSIEAKTWMPGTKAGHDELCLRAPFRWLLFESGSQDHIAKFRSTPRHRPPSLSPSRVTPHNIPMELATRFQLMNCLGSQRLAAVAEN